MEWFSWTATSLTFLTEPLNLLQVPKQEEPGMFKGQALKNV